MVVVSTGSSGPPEGQYWGEYSKMKIEKRDDTHRVAIDFAVEVDGEEMTARLDAPAKISIYDDNPDINSPNSKLGEALKELELIEAVEKQVDTGNKIAQGEAKVKIRKNKTEQDKETLLDILEVCFKGREFKFEVNEDGYVDKFLDYRDLGGGITQRQNTSGGQE